MSHIEELWVENYKINNDKGLFIQNKVKSIKYLKNNSSLTNVPIILVGAGPSLDKNIKHLNRNRDNYLLFCADIVLHKLMQNGIVPDFVVTIDPNPIVGYSFLDIDTSLTKLIAPTTLSPEVAWLWEGFMYLFNQRDKHLQSKDSLLLNTCLYTKGWGDVPNALFVGATMLQVCSIFKPSAVALVGYDFSYTDNKLYADGVLEHRYKYLNADCPANTYVKHDFEFYNIKTSKHLYMYKDFFVKFCRNVDDIDYKKIINCTEGGILKEFEELPLLNFVENCKVRIARKQLGSPKVRKSKRKK